ncbi:transmembrane protease serine 12-like isoform X2 [Latimeria chalumnae]|uniref:transmembrane protease serine 12-like isoform X2 n=1 Tax=Latimeria chalumnae TaxID=7897 RepID=UPI00313B7A6D
MKLRCSVLLLVLWTLWALFLSAHGTHCGIRPIIELPKENRVIGGRDSEAGIAPWQISLQLYRHKFNHFCGGAIINKYWVVTAAHCFKVVKKKLYRIVAGLHRLSVINTKVQIRRIKTIIVHEKFNWFFLKNDIALIQMNFPLIYTSYIQPVCLATHATENRRHIFCYITGWGRSRIGGSMTDTMQIAQINIISQKSCNSSRSYDGLLTENMLCAGSEKGGVDACRGDSGGPFVCYDKKEGKFFLIGTISFGQECGMENFPGVYTRVSKYKDWVESKIVNRNSATAGTSRNVFYMLIFTFGGKLFFH